MTIGDLKRHGQQRAAVSAINLCVFLLGVIAALTGAGLYAEKRERLVEARIAAARIEAARQMMRAQECGWRGLFAEGQK